MDLKQQADKRIEAANATNRDQLASIVRQADPALYNQINLGEPERKEYFYVHHQSITVTRTPYLYFIPARPELKSALLEWKQSTSDTEMEMVQADLSQFVKAAEALGLTRFRNAAYDDDPTVFEQLPVEMYNNQIAHHQSDYVIANESNIADCKICNGNRYVPCDFPPCGGQHIYDCDTCQGTGKVSCEECKGFREVDCRVCSGTGRCQCTACKGKGRNTCLMCDGKGSVERAGQPPVTCNGCSGSGYVVCTSCEQGKIHCINCGGDGKVGCDHCRATGAVTCSHCMGHKKLTCTHCYGDNTDNRYGKIDCKDCAATGGIITLSFVETKITVQNTRRLAWKGAHTFEEDITLKRLEGYVQADEPLQVVYNKVNLLQPFERYDVHSRALSHMILEQDAISKKTYPLLIQEALYYEPVPVATFSYQHLTSGETHHVSVLNYDQHPEVIYHSVPPAATLGGVSKRRGYGYYIGKAFNTKSYRKQTDNINELRLLICLARANDHISDREKAALQQYMDAFKALHPTDRHNLEGYMSQKNLPALPLSALRFSTSERADEAIAKLQRFIPQGVQNEAEKKCMEELMVQVEAAKQKPVHPVRQFFETWQVSLPMVALMMFLIFFSYLFLNKIPEQRAHVLHEELNQKVHTIRWKMEHQDTAGLRQQIQQLDHYSALPLPDSPAVPYAQHWQHVKALHLHQLDSLENKMKPKAKPKVKPKSKKKK